MGPFKTSRRGNKYIITFTDCYNKWSEAVAIKRIDAETTAKVFVDEFLTRYGPPERILTDRGSNYTSAFLNYVFKLTNTVHTTTTAYHPKSNGQSERLNSTIATQLSMYVNSRGVDWDDYLAVVMFSLRTSLHRGIGYSPYEALFGRKPILPLDIKKSCYS